MLRDIYDTYLRESATIPGWPTFMIMEDLRQARKLRLILTKFFLLPLILVPFFPVFSTTPGETGSFFREAYIEQSAGRYGLPSDLVRAVIKVESEFNPKAMSNKSKPRLKRAHGLMQLMPTTAWGECKDLFTRGDFDGLFDERKNIECGTRYLAKMIRRFGSVSVGLIAYNAGCGRTARNFNKPPTRQSALYYPKVLRIWGEYINAAKT